MFISMFQKRRARYFLAISVITIVLLSAMQVKRRLPAASSMNPSIDTGIIQKTSSSNNMAQSYDTDSTFTSSKPRGVFVLKAKKLQQTCRTICSLSRFLNSKTRYPIRIFTEQPYTNETLASVRSYADNVDVQVIVDDVRWKELPPELTERQRQQVLQDCTDFDSPEKAICTTMKAPLSYVYMGYWRYMLMPLEPALQDYEYFVSIDTDAYFTQPFSDPFVLMKRNNLTGIFNVPLFQSGGNAAGIQHASDAIFSLEERRNRYLDIPKNKYFNDKGQWVNDEYMKPSIWGSFYGGRLDFFQSPRFRAFAQHIVPYTYINRTDEQGVVAVAWSLMASDRVWCLSQRGIKLGFFHQMWLDYQQLVRTALIKPPESYNETKNTTLYWVHTLRNWLSFKEYQPKDLILYEEYMRTLGYTDGDDWERCICAPTKTNFLLRESCPNWKDYDKEI